MQLFTCPFCLKGLETTLHGVWGCDKLSPIWEQRNFVRVHGKSESINALMHKLKSAPTYTLHSGIASPCRYVIMTDASWCGGIAGLGAVLIDTESGHWFHNSCQSKAGSAMEAETSVLLLALQHARQCGWEEIHVLSDAKMVVEAFAAGKCPLDWSFFNVSLVILDLIKLFRVCCFFYISPSSNGFVDELAKSARLSSHNAGFVQGEGVPSVIPDYLSVV
uniref:RNase H type-1 domain-containing protein n=1 Tax=Cannabis sativa TaxID=3483 RepID=A0A803QFH8_CANSA